MTSLNLSSCRDSKNGPERRAHNATNSITSPRRWFLRRDLRHRESLFSLFHFEPRHRGTEVCAYRRSFLSVFWHKIIFDNGLRVCAWGMGILYALTASSRGCGDARTPRKVVRLLLEGLNQRRTKFYRDHRHGQCWQIESVLNMTKPNLSSFVAARTDRTYGAQMMLIVAYAPVSVCCPRYPQFE